MKKAWTLLLTSLALGTAKGKAYTRRGRFTDTWVKRDAKWKCVASQSTLVQ